MGNIGLILIGLLIVVDTLLMWHNFGWSAVLKLRNPLSLENVVLLAPPAVLRVLGGLILGRLPRRRDSSLYETGERTSQDGSVVDQRGS